mmetsp:Transcript_7705/g.24239  ORF Transcript_7705/g.24239 Transcript_7705/m.24239 type:complete len:107 (-) Transcript_7705:351-671(-)
MRVLSVVDTLGIVILSLSATEAQTDEHAEAPAQRAETPADRHSFVTLCLIVLANILPPRLPSRTGRPPANSEAGNDVCLQSPDIKEPVVVTLIALYNKVITPAVTR